MRVFVGVDVMPWRAGLLESVDLGLSFALDVGFTDAAEKECLDKVHQGRAEGFSVGDRAGEGMVSGGEAGMPSVRTMWQPTPRVGSLCGCDGVLEGGACCHERCGGEDARLMEFGDGAIDAWGKTEIVLR